MLFDGKWRQWAYIVHFLTTSVRMHLSFDILHILCKTIYFAGVEAEYPSLE
jgi:hypothetical protein